MKNIPSSGMMSAAVFSLIPRRAQGIHLEQGKPVRQNYGPSAPMEAIDNNRFFYVSQ
jgi:hypothetical protein